MCTAISYHGKHHFFGRNLDFELSFGEKVTETPAGTLFPFGKTRYAILGMAHMEGDTPLYYDGMNEKGLAMAGLLFSGYGVYHPFMAEKKNVPSWAFLPWVLGKCENVSEAEELLTETNITREPFSRDLPPSALHWMISDRERSIVVESVAEGLKVYENPAEVLTNNPPFPFHRENLRQYLDLMAEEPQNRFSERLKLTPFSRGMGAFGLPGDWSSASRFVRAAFVKENSPADGDVAQFFHILGAVEMPLGSIRLENGKMERTLYSSCCDLDEGVYYYKTYEDFRIYAVKMKR